MKLTRPVSMLLSAAEERFQLRKGLRLTNDELLYAMSDAINFEPDNESSDWVATHVCQRLLLDAEVKNSFFEGIELTELCNFVENFISNHRASQVKP